MIQWDYPNPSILPIQVTSEHIDALGHVNNVVYVRWLEQCAWQHANSLGIQLSDYQELDRAMVVLRHEIDYLSSALPDEHLQLATWVTESDLRLRVRRQFQLVRVQDQMTLLRASTQYACVALSTGKACRMPGHFSSAYQRALQALTG